MTDRAAGEMGKMLLSVSPAFVGFKIEGFETFEEASEFIKRANALESSLTKMTEENQRLREALKEIKDRRCHWDGKKKRPGCIDFEECDCAEIKAHEALSGEGKESGA